MIFFSKNLKYLRQVSKLSQEELALNIGLNRGNIASYENGSAEPKLQNLQKIANFFNISISQLVSSDQQLSGQMEDDNPSKNQLFTKIFLQADHYKRIIDGFKAYHTYRVSKEDYQGQTNQVVEDYVKLLDVSENFVQHHYEILELLKTQ